MRRLSIVVACLILNACGTVESERAVIGRYVCRLDNLEMTLELTAEHRFVQQVSQPKSAQRRLEGSWQMNRGHLTLDKLLLPNPFPSSLPSTADRARTLKEGPGLLMAEQWYGTVWLIFDPDSDAGFKKQ
jgi:hypothetical protein